MDLAEDIRSWVETIHNLLKSEQQQLLEEVINKQEDNMRFIPNFLLLTYLSESGLGCITSNTISVKPCELEQELDTETSLGSKRGIVLENTETAVMEGCGSAYEDECMSSKHQESQNRTESLLELDTKKSSLEELQLGKLSPRGSPQDLQTKISSLAQEVHSSLHKSFKGKSSHQEPQESSHLESREGKSSPQSVDVLSVGQYCYIYQDIAWHGGLIHKLVLEDLIIVKNLTTHKFHWFNPKELVFRKEDIPGGDLLAASAVDIKENYLKRSLKLKFCQQEPWEGILSPQSVDVLSSGQYCYIYQDNFWYGGLVHKLVFEDLVTVKNLTTLKFHPFNPKDLLFRKEDIPSGDILAGSALDIKENNLEVSD